MEKEISDDLILSYFREKNVAWNKISVLWGFLYVKYFTDTYSAFDAVYSHLFSTLKWNTENTFLKDILLFNENEQN